MCVCLYKDKQLTNHIAVASCAAQFRPLLVEAILAALTVPALCVSLTVNAVQPNGIPQAVPRPSIAPTTEPGCKERKRDLDIRNGEIDAVALPKCGHLSNMHEREEPTP